MKERPILFSAPMVRAILAGRKTQTRRVLKHPPGYPGTSKFVFELHPFAPAEGMRIGPQKKVWSYEDWCGNLVGTYGDCPYGQAGDRLWVRETFHYDNEEYVMRYRAQPWLGLPDAGTANTYYRASEANPDIFPRWRPSIFMPHWASRITLEVKTVRVEKLQEISEPDAVAEGAGRKIWITSPMSAGLRNPSAERGTFREGYKDLWESINGEGSWALNPWVWVIEFQRNETLRVARERGNDERTSGVNLP